MRRKNPGIEEAIRVAGDQYILADLLGVTQPAIHKFLHVNVSAERAKQIERITGIPRERIRPDIYERRDQELPSDKTGESSSDI